jgi:8-oxo-dGTP pyrophosphatase MutT (NUDIX family)
MEPGEAPQDALRRELREEAGILTADLGAVLRRSNGVTFRHAGRIYEQDEWHVVGWLGDGRLGLPMAEEGRSVGGGGAPLVVGG